MKNENLKNERGERIGVYCAVRERGQSATKTVTAKWLSQNEVLDLILDTDESREQDVAAWLAGKRNRNSKR